MASGKFYKIRIGDIWLTSTALENGIECFLSITGAENLLTQIAGTLIETVGGRIVQPVVYVKGKDFEINVSIMPGSVWDDLVALRESLLTDDSAVQIIGTGRPGDFDVQAKPNPQEMFAYKDFDPDYMYDVSMKFYTV